MRRIKQVLALVGVVSAVGAVGLLSTAGAHVWPKAKAERVVKRVVVQQTAEYQRKADTTSIDVTRPVCRRTGAHQFKCPVSYVRRSRFAPTCAERSVYYARLVGGNARVRRVILGTAYGVSENWVPGDGLMDCVRYFWNPTNPPVPPPGY
jgi:hypothetical protein